VVARERPDLDGIVANEGRFEQRVLDQLLEQLEDDLAG
jgi:hypothetical protein